MFPLFTKTFPTDAETLERLLNQSFQRVLITRADPVRVVAKDFPALSEISVTLDGAEVRTAPPARKAIGSTVPALQADRLRVCGRGMSIGPASINLGLEANDVRLNQGSDAQNEIVLGLESAANGRVEVSATKSDLEQAIAEVAKSEAIKHGVTVEDVRLNLHQLGPRALEVEVVLRARKMFFAASVRIGGKAEIDQQMEASLSSLRCTGEGAIGSIACGFLSPQLQKLEGRSFPLAAFSLGEIRLRDVKLQVGEQITVTAVC